MAASIARRRAAPPDAPVIPALALRGTLAWVSGCYVSRETIALRGPRSDGSLAGADASTRDASTRDDDEVVLALREPRTDDAPIGYMTADVRGGGSRECSGFAMTPVRVTAPSTLGVTSITFQTTLLELSGSVRGVAFAVLAFDPASCECTGGGTIAGSDAMVGDTTFTGFGVPDVRPPSILIGVANPGALYRVEACFTVGR